MKSLNVILIGLGTVGGAVARQIATHGPAWHAQGIDIRVVAVLTSTTAIVASPGALDAATLNELADRRAAGSDLTGTGSANSYRTIPADEFSLIELGGGQFVVLDAASGTATTTIARQALAAGGATVYSNKAPLSMDVAAAEARDLWSAVRRGAVRYETTCGAGLPVLSTIASLLATGDEVLEITGCLSGTLGAIFSDIAANEPLSQAIASAKAAGYTEPDPRDDLSGLDVARKALILARTIGRDVDMADIAVESLVPKELASGSVDEFMSGIAAWDAELAERNAAAASAGGALKYVAQVPASGPIKVGIQAVPTATVLGALQGPENIISIRTRRYDRYPLTISGPGAGAEVTAAGMTADMLELAKAGL